MKIVAKIFSCNYETYKHYYKDAIARAFEKDNIRIDVNSIIVEIEELPGDTIQSQRAPSGKHSRTITVLVDNNPTYIIGFSNTGFDDDRKKECESGGKYYNYGNSDYHSNTYLCQGINKIFELYYDTRKLFSSVKLYFYLLDVGKKSYPDNLSNNMTYRELYTLGFEILNIDKIKFAEFSQLGFSLEENGTSYGYTSFNKFTNDIVFISKKNNANIPAYLKCIDYDFIMSDDEEEEKISSLSNREYIYTFKTLGAQSYDNFLTMWTLNSLADRENKKLKFLFSKEKFNFRLNQPKEDVKYTEDFPETITRLFDKIGINIEYENSDEMRQQLNREIRQYEIAKRNNNIRNQELFKNNLREKGLQTKCYLCGCEIEEILEAAHFWEISSIKNASSQTINDVLGIECMKDLINDDDIHSNELFYKKYVLANSGENGVWLCGNHHGLFDSKIYCFDSSNGKVILKMDVESEEKAFQNFNIKYTQLPQEILTEKTKVFLSKRKNDN